MDVIAWLIIAFLNIYYAHGLPFDKPISLGVVKQDLQILGKQFPSADRWPVNRIIKYNDKLEFVVAYDQQTANEANQKTFVMVVGQLSVATFKRSHGADYEIASLRLINKLFVDPTNVYFDDLMQPVQNASDFCITDYYPPYTHMKTDSKPVIEYMTDKQFERELIDHVPRIRDESIVSKADVIKTYIRMKNGNKIHVRYHHTFDIAVLEADFYCLLNNDGRSLIEKTIHFKNLSYDFEKLLIPELKTIGYTYAVRVASFPSHSVDSPTPSLKMVRDVLLKDVLDSISMKTKEVSVTAGVIKYESNKILTLSSALEEQQFAVGLHGNFLTSDGIPFSYLCIVLLAFPQDQSESENELKSSNKFLGAPFFFSCPESGKDSQIVFQEDTDVIEIARDESKTMDSIQNVLNVEPYIEYISYEQFQRTLQILSQVMTFKCAEVQQYPVRSFRLYGDVFLNYDCNTNLVHFATLNLWLNPGEEVSFLGENVRNVSYDSNTKRFQREGIVFSQFKLRQLYPILPDQIPTALRFNSSSNDISFDLKSLEWDLYNIRDDLLKNLLPQWGVVYIDNSVLFVAEKSKRTVDGTKKWAIVVKCNVPKPDSCPQGECMEENLVIYDGTKMIVRDRQEVDVYPLPTKVYWPETRKLPSLNDVFSVSSRVHYIKLSTFRKDMKELSDGLGNICTMHERHGPNDQLILRVYYPHNKEPMFGYYSCALNYIMFSSNFKVIKFSNMYEGETTVRPVSSDGSYPPVMKSKELETTESWKNDRTKYLQSEYVLQDLLYDPTADVFHSKSTFLAELYALRLLPTNWKVTFPEGNSTKLQLGGGIKVDVFLRFTS